MPRVPAVLELVLVPDPDAAAQHDEIIALLSEGLAASLLQQARLDAEAALGRPLRSAPPAADEPIDGLPLAPAARR